MDRATGEFKENQRTKLWVLGFVVAIALNVDSLHLVRVFLMDKGMRDRMVERAEAISDAVIANRDTTEAGLRKAVLQRLYSLDTAKLKVLPKDSVLIKAIGHVFNDTSTALERERADSLLALLDQWQLPIGWSRTEAPYSWRSKTVDVPKITSRPTEPLLSYYTRRNAGGPMIAFLWLIGIYISGWSLSRGAPFWFETLVKLVNIRRSGLKPTTTDERNT